MRQYLELLQKIMDEGTLRSDRTGTGTKSIFGHQMRFDLEDGFPLLTTKSFISRALYTSFFGSCEEIPTLPTYKSMVSLFGTNGQTPREI